MTTGARRRPGPAALAVAVLVVVTLVRAGSLLGYSDWIIDEERVVLTAVGFMGLDPNPRWYGYHPLPMYLLGGLYLAMYLGARALGLVATRAEFASLLFTHDGVFFVPAKLLYGFAYTLGCGVLARTVWRRTGSVAAGAVAFAAPLLIPDGARAAVQARNDTFVFLFLALVVHFTWGAERTLKSVLLAVASCAAAYASKAPAIVLAPVLFAVLAWDASRGRMPWRHVAWGALLFPVAVFCFMPYAFLDFASFRPSVERIAERASGDVFHIGKAVHAGARDKLAGLLGTLAGQTGVAAVAGSALYGLYAALRDRPALGAVLLVLAYGAAFATSATLDSYWLRPVYPFLMAFPVVLAARLAAEPRLTATAARLARRGEVTAGTLRGGLLAALAAAYLAVGWGHLPALAAAALPQGEDTRVTAARWMRENLPEDSVVVMDGGLGHYLPALFTPDRQVLLWEHGYASDQALMNRTLMAGLADYMARAGRTEKHFRVGRTLVQDPSGRLVQHVRLRAGDYVVLSSLWLSRFYRADAPPALREAMRPDRALYAFLRAQEPVRTFSGAGPTIEIVRMRRPLSVGGAPREGGKAPGDGPVR